VSTPARTGAPATPAGDTISIADLRRWVAVALAGAWGGYFLFTGMPQLTLHVFPRTIVFHLLIAAIALLYVASLAAARRLPGGSPLDLPVLAFIGAYALATIASINWRASVEPTLQIGAAIVAFYALSELPLLSARSLRRAFMLAGGALALYALWVVGNDYLNYLQFVHDVSGIHAENIFPPTVPRVHDVSDHPNVLAMLLTLFMPFYALAVYRGSLAERLGGLAGLVVGGWAIFLTLSRGGWLGVTGGCAFTITGAWFTLRTQEREESGVPRSWQAYIPSGFSPTALAAVLGALVLVVGGTLAFLSSSSTRPGWLFRSSLSPRQDAWRAGFHMFRDHLPFGAGPNSFGLLYPEYADGNFLVHTQHAHNGFLQVAVDAGLLGLAALALLVAAVVYTLLRTWAAGSLEQRLLAVTCGGALLGFSIHNQVDAGNVWKAPAIALAFVGAIIARNYSEATGGRTRGLELLPARGAWTRYAGMAIGGALLALLCVQFAGWWRIDRAHRDYYNGVEALNKGEPGAIANLQKAVNADSSDMAYQMLLGQAQATAFQSTQKTDHALIDAAVIHLERAVALDNRSDLAHANLARAYALAGRADDAKAEAKKTRYIARFHVPPILAAGEVFEMIGDTDDAIDTYGQVISMDSGLADALFWQDTAFRREHVDAILEKSSLGYNPCTYGAYLVQVHRSDPASSLDALERASKGCQLLLFSLPNDLVLRVSFAKILMAQGQIDDARGHLEFAVNRQPDFGPARTELGRLYEKQGDLEKARHEWVVGGQLEEAESILLLGNSYAAGQVPRVLIDRLQTLVGGSGSSIQNDIVSVLYYRLKYGRQSPRWAMIPGDWSRAVPRLYQQMTTAVQTWEQSAGLNP
jgi:tetratricopeptide (TPR) repeat protein